MGRVQLSKAKGAVLEKGCVYVVPLLEHLSLPDSISGIANPKSSTGRLDIFTRLIADDCEIFDHVPDGYKGPLYAEISPRSFSIRVRCGSRLNQIQISASHRDAAEPHGFCPRVGQRAPGAA